MNDLVGHICGAIGGGVVPALVTLAGYKAGRSGILRLSETVAHITNYLLFLYLWLFYSCIGVVLNLNYALHVFVLSLAIAFLLSISNVWVDTVIYYKNIKKSQ